MRRTKVVFLQRGWEDNPGLLWISAVLKADGFTSQVRVADRRTWGDLQELAPEIIAFSVYTGEQRWAAAAIARIRAAGIRARIIAGGPHPTFFPDFLFKADLDAICVGEGEQTMLDYARAIDAGGDARGIANLHLRTPEGVERNSLRPLVADLDTLPFPDRSYYDRYGFLARNPYKTFITSRGCPFKCTFCFNHALVGLYGQQTRYVRRRSVANVIAEIIEVRRRWGIDEIRFSDDHFALSAAWLREFCGVYRLEVRRPYTVNVRADALDEERIVCLKESGCRLVCFGVETGDEELRNRVLMKNIRDEQIVRVAALLKKHRLPFLTSNIIGLPGETAADAWKTVALNRRIGTDLPWYSMMQYFPGTQIHREAARAGLLDEAFSVDDITGYFGNSYLRQPNIGELQNIHSFSILVSWLGFLEDPARVLARRVPPNRLFRAVFRLSYWVLTASRAHLGVLKLLRGFRHYARKALG